MELAIVPDDVWLKAAGLLDETMADDDVSKKTEEYRLIFRLEALKCTTDIRREEIAPRRVLGRRTATAEIRPPCIAARPTVGTIRTDDEGYTPSMSPLMDGTDAETSCPLFHTKLKLSSPCDSKSALPRPILVVDGMKTTLRNFTTPTTTVLGIDDDLRSFLSPISISLRPHTPPPEEDQEQAEDQWIHHRFVARRVKDNVKPKASVPHNLDRYCSSLRGLTLPPDPCKAADEQRKAELHDLEVKKRKLELLPQSTSKMPRTGPDPSTPSISEAAYRKCLECTGEYGAVMGSSRQDPIPEDLR